MVTSWPSRLSQKSSPYLSGCRVELVVEIRLLLLGTERKPSTPVSRALNFWVGGLLSLPRINGVTVLLLDKTVMFVGDSISVMNKKLGLLAERNSDTRPPREMKSPTLTRFKTEVEEEKMKRPLDFRTSVDFSPRI